MQTYLVQGQEILTRLELKNVSMTKDKKIGMVMTQEYK